MLDLKSTWTTLFALGPAAMFFVTIADTAFLPTAQAVDLLILTQAAAAPESALWLGLSAVAGSTVGAMILYGIAHHGGGWALRRAVSQERLEGIRGQLRKYDALALFIPTALPAPLAPMKVFIAAAGALKLGWVRTGVVVAAARVVRYGLLIYLGIEFGDQAWALIREHSSTVLGGVAAAVLLWFLGGYLRKRRALKP
jgi:membrane protein YqaA with SNARE-associated domain